ncbi:autotransporter domain-containing protein [Luteolibacter sp. LG18]|uniref:autotransporter outer membrane beta-barrel domain-containing protein n=1 Tax=Luteolibacter sp. LG18 TaxID=2819286 RepID=UPI002B322EF9|nr:autotransporter [Luteolibacter sp. LG18]
MKPKFLRLAKTALPALIVFGSAQILHGAIIVPDTPGNVFVPGNYNGGLAAADSIAASGGTTPPYTVTVANGAILTGNAGGDVVVVTSANYTINNAGQLTGSGGRGIGAAGFGIDVINTGTISGGAGNSAVSAGSIGTLTNSSLIRGDNTGIFVTGNATTITNNLGGIIQGDFNADGFGNGIRVGGALNSLTNRGTISGVSGVVVVGNALIDNYSSITGNAGFGGDGVNVGGDALLTNYLGATITGAANGVVVGANSDVLTYGSITGNGGSGVVAGNGSTVNTLTTYDVLTSLPIAGGSITGSVHGVSGGNGLIVTNTSLGTITGNGGNGILALDSANIINDSTASITGSVGGINAQNSLILNNSGSVTGNGGDGVHAQDSGSVTNNLGATISGTVAGVWLDDSATVVNNGTITGGTGDGVRVSDNSTVTNTGSISGTTGIQAFAGGGTFSLTNSSTITGTGGTAIDGAISGIDTLNLNSGSTVTGAIITRGGADIINLTSGASSSLVNGAINMGLGNDTLNLINGQTAIGGATIRVTGLVSFTETINKSNAGVAFLNGGANVNTVNITGGGLYINGPVDGNTTSQATINAGGSALGGTGTWDANIALTAGGFSAGSVPITLDAVPTNAIGQLNLTGNVTHSPGSFIRWDVAPQTAVNNGVNSDLIVQTGANTYNVNGANIRIAATNINQAIGNGTYTVVDSASGIVNFGTMGALGVQFNGNIVDSGPFFASESGANATTTVLTNFFTTAALADGGTNIVLTVQHNFAGLPGITPNQASLGAALDASVNTPNPLVQDFIAALDYSNLATVQASLAAIDPSTYLALTASVVNSDYTLHRQIGDRLAGLRDSDEGGGLYRTQVSAKGGMAPSAPASVSSSGPFNVWGGLSYDWQDYSGPTSLSDYDGNVSAFTVGIDYRVSPNFVIGALLNGSKSDLDYTGGSSDIDSLRGAIYATLGGSTGWYSDALVGYGNHSIDASRSLGGVLVGASGANFDANSVQALWTVGYTFDAGSFKHGPFAGVEYQNIDADGFTAGGPFPIGISSYSVDSLRGLIGYRIKGACGRFSPYASAAYAHEFEDGGNTALATLPNGAPFSVVGPELNSAILLTAGTGISLTPALILDIGYRGEISTESEGLDSHGGSIGLNYNF